MIKNDHISPQRHTRGRNRFRPLGVALLLLLGALLLIGCLRNPSRGPITKLVTEQAIAAAEAAPQATPTAAAPAIARARAQLGLPPLPEPGPRPLTGDSSEFAPDDATVGSAIQRIRTEYERRQSRKAEEDSLETDPEDDFSHLVTVEAKRDDSQLPTFSSPTPDDRDPSVSSAPTPTPTPDGVSYLITVTPTPTSVSEAFETPTPTPTTVAGTTPTPTITPGGPTLTPTPSPTPTVTPGGPTLTPTPTVTPGGPTSTPTPTPVATLTPTPTVTPGGPTATPSALQEIVDLRILPASLSVSPGQTFDVDIQVEPNGQPVNVAQAVLLFDTFYLEAVSVTLNQNSPMSVHVVPDDLFDNTAGTATLAGTTLKFAAELPTTAFTLGTVRFRVGQGVNYTDTSLDQVQFGTVKSQANLDGAEVTGTLFTLTVTIGPSPTATPTPTP